MPRALDTGFVTAYAKGPPKHIEQAAIAAHQQVRSLLGDTDYLTFLQGSYRNGTALENMNDVDLVAVLKKPPPGSTLPTWPRSSRASWEALFRDIEGRLRKAGSALGPWKREDKCIRVHATVNIDIVPAIPVTQPDKDPIAIYSFRDGAERKNWPREHHALGARKGAETSGHFKQAVRLFKRWRTCYFRSSKVAPSYYLECLLYRLPKQVFAGDLADNFVQIARELLHRRFPNARAYHSSQLPRIAGEGNLLTQAEWDFASFEQFHTTLQAALPHAERALLATDPRQAQQHWKAAFHGQ